MKSCSFCGQPADTGTTFKLTDDEKKALAEAGVPAEEVSYCAPCMRVFRDRKMGAEVLKGFFEMKLRIAGVASPEKHAKRFHEFLLKRAASKPVS